MRCVRVLVLLLLIAVCWAQQVADTEELPQQQVSTRRRRVSDLADAEGEDGDVAKPDDGDEERLPTANRPNRPRNPNRRRRKRKRIPPPRPLYEDYEDTLAFPTTGDRPGAADVDHERFLDERPREPPTGPEHRSLPPLQEDRRRVRDEEDDDDHRRPLRRRPPASPDREGQHSIHRPLREHPGFVVDENGEPRPIRPLRRRRKNRRRPPIGPPDGIREEPVEESDLPPKDVVPEDVPVILEKDAIPEVILKTPLTEGDSTTRRRNRPIDDIPLGSLRGEVRLPTHPRQRARPPLVESGADAEVRPQTTTPESLPAENLPSNHFDNLPPRQRRRRIRPRAHHKSTTEGTVAVTTVESVTAAPEPEDMLADREPLKQREEAPMIRKEDDDGDDDEGKDSFPAATSGKGDDDNPDVEERSIVSGDITLQTTPIKISLSDLLREKNISIEEILKDVDEEPSPPPRFQRPLKPRPPPPTPKTIVTPKLTQLSRVHQFLQKPKLDQGNKDVSKKDSESKVQSHPQQHATTSTTTHRAYTPTSPSTHRTTPPTTTTTTTTTPRKYAPTTPTTPRFHAPTTARGTTERVVGRPVGFGARAPALNMQETEDIDPVKMTGKPRPGNTKAAEFLKSRVRLPPSSVLFPSVKAGQGARGGSPSAPDQEPLPARVAPPPPARGANAESNRIPAQVGGSDAVLTHTNVPVYVLNPKYYKASQPKPEAKPPSVEAKPADTLSPTETNVIPETEKSVVATTRRADTTESFGDGPMITDADPVRLNIPLKSGAEEDAPEKQPGHGKSAEDEIVELLETENGSSRLSRILASRNMTLSELIEHRERGASQQHISDIFLRNEESKAVPNVYAEESTTEAQTTMSVTRVPKIEEVQTTVLNNPVKKLNVEIVKEEEDEEENSKRVPRVFEGLVPFKPKVEAMPELEFKDTYPESTLEVGTDYVIETYRTNGKHENPGKVREIVTKVSDEDHEEFAGLPSGMKSAILASSAILGLAIFVFLAIFVTCKVRRRQSVRRRYANRSPILSHDVEKSRSMTPVLRHSGYKDMTEERRYYLWNTIRKTLRYK